MDRTTKQSRELERKIADRTITQLSDKLRKTEALLASVETRAFESVVQLQKELAAKEATRISREAELQHEIEQLKSLAKSKQDKLDYYFGPTGCWGKVEQRAKEVLEFSKDRLENADSYVQSAISIKENTENRNRQLLVEISKLRQELQQQKIESASLQHELQMKQATKDKVVHKLHLVELTNDKMKTLLEQLGTDLIREKEKRKKVERALQVEVMNHSHRGRVQQPSWVVDKPTCIVHHL